MLKPRFDYRIFFEPLARLTLYLVGKKTLGYVFGAQTCSLTFFLFSFVFILRRMGKNKALHSIAGLRMYWMQSSRKLRKGQRGHLRE